MRGWGKVKSAADYTGMSQRTVRTWLKRGLPHSKVGGTILIEYRQLDQWLRSFAVEDQVDQLVSEFLKDF